MAAAPDRSALLRFFCFAKAPGAPRPGPRPPRGPGGLGGLGGRNTTEFLHAGGVWDPLRAARGRTRRCLHNRLKRRELPAKINNIFSWQESALRDPRRRGSDDVAGDAHVLDEGRDSDAQLVAIAVLLKLATRTMPLLSYVLVPGD